MRTTQQARSRQSEAEAPSFATVMSQLKSMRNPKNVAGMARFGINTAGTYGISIPNLRRIGRTVGKKNHALAQELWATRVHEARILASIVDDPDLVTARQMDSWVADFDSWDICDQCCSNLFDKTKIAYEKAVEWSRSDREFVKRAGFALMACLAVHAKKIENGQFVKLLPLIVKGSDDDRNFVKKSVNWALRQIGKRNLELNTAAVKTAKEIARVDAKSAKWIAADALRELESDAVQKRLRNA